MTPAGIWGTVRQLAAAALAAVAAIPADQLPTAVRPVFAAAAVVIFAIEHHNAGGQTVTHIMQGGSTPDPKAQEASKP